MSTLGQLLLARDILQTNTCGVTVSRASTLRDLSMLKNEDSAFRHSLLYARHHVAVFVYHYTSCDTRVITWQSSPSAAALMPETTGPCWGRRHTPLRLWELCIEPLFKLQLGHVHDFLSHELWIEKIYNQSTYYNPSKKWVLQHKSASPYVFIVERETSKQHCYELLILTQFNYAN